MRQIYKGLMFGLPCSIMMWALLASAVYALACRHPHALARAEKDIELALGHVPRSLDRGPSV